ncbi:MAG: hypothetical protein JO256_02155 [Alphaproteobacteria bacterium]|nr:hypothetical protein [Alphaproteobacteria bacterium]
MTLTDLASIGSFISGVAVLLSLIYVSVQIRQAKHHQQAAIRLGRADRIVQMCFAAGDNAAAEAVLKGHAGAADISEIQLAQYYWICRGFFYHCEEEYFQHKEGLANEAYYASFLAGTKKMFCLPGLRVQWRQQRESFVPEFVAFMEALMAQAQPVWTSDAVGAWTSAIAAEKAGHV